MDFKLELNRYSALAEDIVRSYLPKAEGFQKTVLDASCYSVEAGGKRLRPIMMLAAYQLVRKIAPGAALTEEDRKVIGPFMAAIEMIHSSSLVHDDLPCMDNDTMRRGKPSTWAKYGEDMGTLAGDALMIYAFETAVKSTASPDRVQEAVRILAEKTGVYGMIGGQTVDVELTGSRPNREQLVYIYENKTGALIQASLMIGAVLAGADADQTKALGKAALDIGMAFQIRDDILDVISTEEELGKPIGSDAECGKVTWLTFYGMEQSEKDVKTYTDHAVSTVRELGGHAFLEELLLYLVTRKK